MVRTIHLDTERLKPSPLIRSVGRAIYVRILAPRGHLNLCQRPRRWLWKDTIPEACSAGGTEEE